MHIRNDARSIKNALELCLNTGRTGTALTGIITASAGTGAGFGRGGIRGLIIDIRPSGRGLAIDTPQCTINVESPADLDDAVSTLLIMHEAFTEKINTYDYARGSR